MKYTRAHDDIAIDYDRTKKSLPVLNLFIFEFDYEDVRRQVWYWRSRRNWTRYGVIESSCRFFAPS